MTNKFLLTVEQDLEGALTTGWQVVRDAVVQLEPEMQALLKDLFNEAVKDLTSQLPVDEIVTKVLNLAEARSLGWVVELETSVLRGLAGLLGARA